jgi:hypothetical protein
MMGANPRIETVLALGHAQPRFADCKTCGKLTLQTGKSACRDRNACHGVVVRLFDLAETEHGALAGKLAR